MKATANYPIYTVKAVAADGTKYTLSNVLTDLTLDEPERALAQSVSMSLRNVKVGSGHLSGCITDDMRIYVTADDGTKKEEVFRGYVWNYNYESSTEKEIRVKAYDNLIYLQQSKDCLYFSAGKYSDAIIKSICSKWGIKLSYTFSKIKHSKLPFNNKYISDIIIEILEAVRKQTGAKYVTRSVKDTLQINPVGSNKEIYTFKAKKSAILTKSGFSKDSLVTKVVIYGNEDKNDRRAVVATVNGSNLSKYGTLQDVVTMSSNTTLADAKKEANEILKEKGKPEREYALEAPDVPWVHKGDLIKISAGDLSGNYIVKGATHDALKKTMSLEVEKK